ncbi:xanthine dehydrogenase family protein molybdopterin-binding subunit [Reyranella sp. CPCC 100927]|uniref:xanthine dehydrogenase family protein molybdopterin-binding subunit n=1 Tax=Reyranella sp. CPCC 100927 TaxID=2599616 RepID=UPI0011B6EA3C|nr:xanthine dehydrogenase family protein molybdopterin-binding subunit [Reyranella sp. CPCC 100927]TWT11732.1 xanthine dehydrogenase family protein molybdopterin-binding subunit [Reyranella sp. CPCC 100927]
MTAVVTDKNDDRVPTRIEAGIKVKGAARFAAEIPIQGVMHAALVQAPLASARIRHIDASKARAQPGVVSVITHEAMPRLNQGAFLALLREPRVHFAGQPVAVVVAETATHARRAVALINVDYEALPAITSVTQGSSEAFAPKVAGRTSTDSRRGEPEGAMAAAEVTIEKRYTTPTHNHLALEPQCVIAVWDRDGAGVTVHTGSQAVFAHRKAIADGFGLSVGRVRVVSKYLGGGFGSKGSAWLPCLMLGIAAARHVGRPVKLELTRAQMFTLVGRRQETIQTLKLGAMRDGRLVAMTHDTVAQTSSFADYADPVATPTRVLYACPNVATSHRLVRVNAPQPNPMRAPGEGPGSFALESALDELAHVLKMDPLALRLRNYAERDQHVDLPWSSNGLRDCCRVGAQSFGWARRPIAIGTMRDGHHVLGWGMAAACYPVYRMASEAVVRIEANGTVRVRCGTQDMGSGTYTVLAQLAAEALGVPVDGIDVELGDTALPEGPYSGGSMATASFTPAVEAAAGRVRQRLIDLVIEDGESPLHGLSADQLVLSDGYIRAGTGNAAERLADVVARRAPDGIEAFADAAPDAAPRYSSYGYGAIFAEVRVDVDLGEVRVVRLTAAYAAGRILNRRLARSQFIGGIVGGIGMALHETTIMDERLGRIVNDNLADYLIPVHADMPAFDIHMIDEDDPHLAGGIKGIGMLGTVGTAAAIANAVFHATGRRIRDLPIRLEHCL